jgi:hypothetical protein
MPHGRDYRENRKDAEDADQRGNDIARIHKNNPTRKQVNFNYYRFRSQSSIFRAAPIDSTGVGAWDGRHGGSNAVLFNLPQTGS